MTDTETVDTTNLPADATETAARLCVEYRVTMPADALHLWAQDAVSVMRALSSEVKTLTRQLASMTIDRDSWSDQADMHAQTASDALQQIEVLKRELAALRGEG